MMLVSILALVFWGLKLGIDFTGGSLIELDFKNNRPANQEVQEQLADLNLSTLHIQPTGANGLLIRTVSLSEDSHQEILTKINQLFKDSDETSADSEAGQQTNDITKEGEIETAIVPASVLGIVGEGTENLNVEVTGQNVGDLIIQPANAELNKTDNFTELRFDSIGPTIGKELQHKAFYAIIIVLLAIIAYIAYAFRKVSQPVESWKFGLSAIIALAHDILIITGIYAILGHFLNFQADALFVTALLTILGFSVHDSIVTFDRVRENLYRHQDETFETVVNRSVNETIVRSLNTSITTLFVLLAIYLFGGQTIKNFVLALMMGVVIGTYSSIFVANPLLVVWYKLKKY